MEDKKDQKPGKLVHFWHFSRKSDLIDNYSEKGISGTQGKGVGGQADGFYVWTNKKEISGHMRFNCRSDGFLIHIAEPVENITVRNGWQPDFERNTSAKFLISCHAAELAGKNLNLPCCIYNGQGVITKIFEALEGPDSKVLKFHYEPRFGDKDYNFRYGPWDFQDPSDYTGFSQALHDRLVERSPAYCQEIDQMMQSEAMKVSGMPLKYTGPDKKDFALFEDFSVHRTPNGSLRQKLLYCYPQTESKVLSAVILAGRGGRG